jgi:integrase
MHVMPAQAKSDFPIKVSVGSVTVKVYFTPTRGNDGYTVAWHEGTRRERRMFGDLRRARQEAKAVAERLNAGRGMALSLTGADRDAYLHATAKLRPLNVALVPAIDEYVAAKKWNVPLAVAAKSYSEAHSAKLPDKTVQDAYLEMLEAKKKDGASTAYLIDLKTRLGHFSRDFQVSLADVSTEAIDAWLRALPLSPRSRNNHRNAVVALFNFGKASGYLNRDRTTVAAHTAVARRKVEAIEVFSPVEFAKLLAAADDAVLPFFVLGGFCGLRTVEVKRLLWENIRWPERSIVISSAIAKTRTRRIAPLTDPAASWLVKWKAKMGRVITVDKLHKRVADVCKGAGVTWKPNGLRHSFITCRVASTKDFIKTAFEAGNSPQVIRSNYDAVATEAEGKLWFSIMPETAKNVISMKIG